jgi:hypothetical protein
MGETSSRPRIVDEVGSPVAEGVGPFVTVGRASEFSSYTDTSSS